MDSTCSQSTGSTNKNKKSLFQHFEMNKLDKIIENDSSNEKKLTNDVHDNELKFGFRKNNKTKEEKSSLQPTPVTLVNIRGGKKGRTNHEKV